MPPARPTQRVRPHRHPAEPGHPRDDRRRRDRGRARDRDQPDPAGEPRSQARQGRLSHQGELPARARRHGARQARRAQIPRDRSHQGRGAGSGLRLSRAADRAAQAPLDHRRLRQSEKLDRAARRVHAADRRPAGRVRQRRGRLFGAAVHRDLPAHLLHQGSLRLAAQSDQVPPPRRPAARCRRAAGPGRRPALCARSIPMSGWSRARRRSATD